eukprot:474559_1
MDPNATDWSLWNFYSTFVLISIAIQCCNFSLSYFFRIDNFTGSTNFCTLTILSYYWSNCYNTKQSLMTFMLLIWSFRLGIFLLYRMFIRDKGGDDRLDKLRIKPQNLLTFWVLHCSWCLIVSLPVTLFNLIVYIHPTLYNNNFCNKSLSFNNIECIGLFIWLFGMIFSSIADIQKLQHYQSNKNNKTQKLFCNIGVWKYSRNPNFAGECILWKGMAIISSYNLYMNVQTIHKWYLIFIPYLSPLFTAIVLIGWSGIPFRERKYWKQFGNQNKEYLQYRNNTSIIWPLPIGVYALIPDTLKRTIFCEFKMFEYKTKAERRHYKSKSN